MFDANIDIFNVTRHDLVYLPSLYNDIYLVSDGTLVFHDIVMQICK